MGKKFKVGLTAAWSPLKLVQYHDIPRTTHTPHCKILLFNGDLNMTATNMTEHRLQGSEVNHQCTSFTFSWIVDFIKVAAWVLNCLICKPLTSPVVVGTALRVYTNMQMTVSFIFHMIRNSLTRPLFRSMLIFNVYPPGQSAMALRLI
ncbi:hypothetical protein J6590_016386 [Homalodisca vitripennis]|nr:hypothetical protein J6590_016386 [Homalodisca vitripennis]